MTPIEQKIKEAIIQGHDNWRSDQVNPHIGPFILPLVMSALKPLLDDARELALRLDYVHDSPCDCEQCKAAGRVLAEIEPGPGAADDQHPTCKEFRQAIGDDQGKYMGIPLTDEPLSEWKKRRDAAKNGPGADSSPACANCGRNREDHANTGTCQHYMTASQMAMIRGQYLSEQSRQAAACETPATGVTVSVIADDGTRLVPVTALAFVPDNDEVTRSEGSGAALRRTPAQACDRQRHTL